MDRMERTEKVLDRHRKGGKSEQVVCKPIKVVHQPGKKMKKTQGGERNPKQNKREGKREVGGQRTTRKKAKKRNGRGGKKKYFTGKRGGENP